MLPRVALEYGQSWCARLIRSRPSSRVSCGASRSSAAARPKPPLFRRPDPDACGDPRSRSSRASAPPRSAAARSGNRRRSRLRTAARDSSPARPSRPSQRERRARHRDDRRSSAHAPDGLRHGRLGRIENLESVVHVRPCVRPRQSCGVVFEWKCPGHGSRPGIGRSAAEPPITAARCPRSCHWNCPRCLRRTRRTSRPTRSAPWRAGCRRPAFRRRRSSPGARPSPSPA